MPGTVCIISPGNLASNPRLLKEADALHDAGYTVTAVVCDYTRELREIDDEIAARAPWKVVRVPRPLGERAVAMGANRLARLLESAGGRAPVAMAARASGGPARTLRRAALEVPADIYIGHYTAGLAAAASVARRRGAMLAFDAEDFHPGEGIGGPGESFRMKLIETFEEATLPFCAYVTAASPMIGAAYARRYGVAPVTVLNVFPLDMAPVPAPVRAPTGKLESLRAYWFSQTIGPDRGLQAFLRAIPRAKTRLSIDIRGGDQWGHGDGLMSLARDLGIGDRVTILPKAPPDQMAVLAADYDIGLSLESDTPENRRLCLGNKIFTYMLAGLPLVMSDTPAQCDLALQLGAAATLVSLSDPDAMAAQLDRLAGSPDVMAIARGESLRLARCRYNWDVEKNTLLGVVGEAFASVQRRPVWQH